jgi:hypothetical protein
VSSAMNFPITNASLRLVVVCIGIRSIRCTNAGAMGSATVHFSQQISYFSYSVTTFRFSARNGL